MFNKKKYRVLTIIVLVLILFTLFVWYGNLESDPEQGNYPGAEELVKDYDKYVGEKVEVTGKVVDEDPIRIEIEYGEQKKGLTIIGTDKQVDKGDRFSVYGTVKENGTIDAENTVVFPFLNYIYMYLISIVGATWILIRIIKQWRWNSKELQFERRDEPLPLKQILTGGDSDG